MKKILLILICITIICLCVSCDGDNMTSGHGLPSNAGNTTNINQNGSNNNANTGSTSSGSGSSDISSHASSSQGKEVFDVNFDLFTIDNTDTKALGTAIAFTPAAYFEYTAIPNFSYESGTPYGKVESMTNLCTYAEHVASLKLESGSWTITIQLKDSSGIVVYSGQKTIEVGQSTPSQTFNLFPVNSGNGSISMSISVPVISSAGTLSCTYARLGGSDTTVTLNSPSHSSGQNVTYTRTLSNLPVGIYLLRFTYTDTVNAQAFNGGETITAVVVKGQTTNITGNIQSMGNGTTITLYYNTHGSDQSSISVNAVVGQDLDDILSNTSLDDDSRYYPYLFTNSEGSGNAVSNTTLVSANDIYYLHRKAYNLYWNYNGGSVVSAGTTAGSILYNTAITAPTLSKTGYTMTWSPSLSSYMPASDTTYEAQWTANTYSVRFNSNKPAGATGSVSGSMSNESFTYDTSKALTSNAFSLTGYTFQGWATSSGGAKVYNNGQSVSNLTSTNGATFDLYAKWNANSYSGTFNLNGGNIGGSTSNVVRTQTYDSAWDKPSNPVRTGYTFGGWGETSNGSALSTTKWTFATNKTIYALWSANTFYVAFNKNKPENASHDVSGSMSNEDFTYGTSKALTTNAYSLTGWTFGGWNSSSNGSGTDYTNGQSVSNLTATNNATVTLYAKWTPVSVAITLNPNGGTMGGSSSSVVVNGNYDSSYPISGYESGAANVPTKGDGYVFIGWSLE